MFGSCTSSTRGITHAEYTVAILQYFKDTAPGYLDGKEVCVS